MKRIVFAALALFWTTAANADIGSIVTFPGGQNGSVQVNKHGNFYGDSGFTYSTSTHRVTVSSITVNDISVSGLTSGQCVQTAAGGQLTTTGSACGAGGGGGATGGTINNSTQFSAGYYSFATSSNVISGSTGVLIYPSSVSINGTFKLTNVGGNAGGSYTPITYIDSALGGNFQIGTDPGVTPSVYLLSSTKPVEFSFNSGSDLVDFGTFNGFNGVHIGNDTGIFGKLGVGNTGATAPPNGLQVTGFTQLDSSMTVLGAIPILSTQTLQSGATFYVSSGTVNTAFYTRSATQLNTGAKIDQPGTGPVSSILNFSQQGTNQASISSQYFGRASPAPNTGSALIIQAAQTGGGVFYINGSTIAQFGFGPGGVAGVGPAASGVALQNGTTFFVNGNMAIGSAGATVSTGPVPTDGLYVYGATILASSASVLGASGLGVTYGAIVGSMTVSNLASGQCVQTSAGGLLTVTGSACGAGGGGSSTLAVTTGTSAGFTGAAISSPTAVLLFNSATYTGSLQGSATFFLTPSPSSVTLQGNSISLSALSSSMTAVGFSTGSLQTQVTALGVSTNTLAVSTGTLYTLANTKINFSSITANIPVTWNNATGVIGLQPISLSTGVVSILPAANMVSTAAFTSSTQTWTAAQTFISSVTLSGAVVFSSNVVLSNGQGTSGQVYTTGVGGAPSWTTPSSASSSSLGISSGSATVSVIVSSPTSNVVVDSNTINAALQGTTTSFLSLRPSSVTLQGNTFNGANQLVQLNGSTQLPAVSGANLTNLTGSNITGTVPSTVLPSTVAYTSSTQTWTAGQTFISSVTHTGVVLISTTIILSGATGTAGQVATSGGPGAATTWTTIGGAGLASTQTWTGSNTFSNGSNSTASTLIATSSGTGNTLQVNANGNFGTNDGTSGGALFNCNNTGSQGPCVQIYSNQGVNSALTAPLYIVQNNTAWDNPNLYILAKGTSPQNGIRLDGNDYSTLELIDTKRYLSNTKHNGQFQMSTHNDSMRFERRRADNSQFDSAFSIDDSTGPGIAIFTTDYSLPVSTVDIQGSLGIGKGVAGITAAPLNGLLVQGNILNQALGASLGVCTDGSKNLTTAGCVFGSSGASALAITTGTSAGFSSTASSPTAVVNFDNTRFSASLSGSATGFVTLLSTQTFSSMTVTGQFTTGGPIIVTGGSVGHWNLTEGLQSGVIGTGIGQDVFWADVSSNAISVNFNGNTSTYTVVTSSVAPVSGQCTKWVSGGPNLWTLGSVSCGSTASSSGSGTVTASTQYQVPYYSATGSSNVVTGAANLTNNASTVTIGGISAYSQTNVTTQTATGVLFDYTGSSQTISSMTVAGGAGLKVINGLVGSTATFTAWNVTTTSASVTGAGGLNVIYSVTAATMNLTAMNVTATSATVTGSGGLKATYNVTAGTMNLTAMNVTSTSATITGSAGENVTYGMTAGSITIGGLFNSTSPIKTGDYTMTQADMVILSSVTFTASSATLTLPTGNDGQTIYIWKVDSDSVPVVLKCQGSDLIAGATAQFRLQAPGQGVELIYNLALGRWNPQGGLIPMVPYIGSNCVGDPNGAVTVATSSDVYFNAAYVPSPVVIKGIRFEVGAQLVTQSSMTVAVYDNTGANGTPGTMLSSATLVAVPAVGWNTINLQTPKLLVPGTYYLAMSATTNNALQTFNRCALTAGIGQYLQTQSNTMALPNPASTSTASTSRVFPLIGIVYGGLTQ